MEIRNAETGDARRIAEVHVASWRVAYRDLLPAADLDQLEVDQFASWRGRRIEAMDLSNSATLVAVDDSGVVGFVDVGPTRDEHLDANEVAELYAIYFDPEHWGSGGGRALIVEAESVMTSLGFSSAMLWVLEGNDRARRFYDAAGWAPDGGRQLERIIATELYEVRYAKILT